MGMNLTIEEMRKIVDGAPDWATGINTHSDVYFGGDKFCRGDVLLADLRTALADHDRTDHVSDIRNHISPTTKVIER